MLKTEAELFMYLIDHEVNIPIWVDATNWNARRFFAKGKCSGVFHDSDEDGEGEEKGPEQSTEAHDRTKKLVHGRVWVETNYHELLMFLVEDMHIGLGGYTTDREYFKKKSQGLFDAPCFQLRTGIGYARFMQLRKFFCMRRTREEDVIRDPTNPRNNKTKSKTHMLDEFMETLQERWGALLEPGNCYAIDESMIPWYGKYCPIRVYIKGKPFKYGMKLWQLDDWPTGYCRGFRMYPGRGDRWPHETPESMLGWSYAERVVLCLTRNLPGGSFFTIDRNFMTPKLAVYMKKERHMYVTGTMKRNTKYIDKEILFKKSVTVPRGFFNWSEDSVNGVTQCCWMDREAVPFCSGGFGARTVGTSRLTSHQVEVLAGSRKVKSKRMKSPHCSVIYNATMWTVDIDDFQALNQGTSWERGCRSRTWWYIGLMGLLDRTAVNVFIVMKERLKPTKYRHNIFNQNLMTQLFHIARKQNPIQDLSAANIVEEYDYSILWPCAPVSFHNPLPEVRVGEEVLPQAMVFPGHVRGELLDLRACFNCRKVDRFKPGALRKDSKRKPGSIYKLWPRTKVGCRTCGVPLCRKKENNCWVEYHKSSYCGESDYIDPINWLNV